MLALRIRWPKYWSFSVSRSNEYLGLISFRMPSLISLLCKELSRAFSSTTVKSINSLVVSLFYCPTLTSIHDHWKTIALTIWTFVSKVMPLFLNMLSRFVIAFLPRSKCVLISWLQSPSTVILETKNIKSVTVFIVSSSIFNEVMVPDAMIFIF